MRLTVDQAHLATGVQSVSRAVSGKTTIPVLQGILISAAAGKITLKAYDMEMGISCPVDGEVVEEGAIVLPAKVVAEIVKRIPGGKISIDVDRGNYSARLTWSRSEFTIHGLDAGQFPVLPETGGDAALTVDAEAFRGLIRQTTFATAQGDARPVLTGVLLEAQGRDMAMVAIDGVRLALRRAYLSKDGSAEVKAIVPGRALNEAARLVSGGEGGVTVQIGRGHASFAAGGAVVVSRLLEGQFPPYQQIIPKSYSTTVTVRREEFHDACERASVVSYDQDNTVHLRIARGGVAVSAASPDVGKVREEIDAQVEGEEIDIAFNARLVMEGLRALDSDDVLLRTTGKFSPACIRPVEHENFVYVVMPLRTADVA
ncbi:MAG: DNA polymerase III subunit beta [Firmicutes bacterium]|nr:DNA polymerase III subunit beta [Bacillota bacterium]